MPDKAKARELLEALCDVLMAVPVQHLLPSQRKKVKAGLIVMVDHIIEVGTK